MSIFGGNRLAGFDPYSSYTRETSMTAGLLCLYGLINLVPGVYDLVLNTTDGQDWSGDEDTYPPVVLHLAALIQVTFSVVAMAVGFQWLVSGAGSRMCSIFSLVLSLLSLFTLTVGVSYIAFLADKLDVASIFRGHDQSNSEDRSVATLLVLGYIAYAANNFVALIHLNHKLYMFQSDKGAVFTRAMYRKLYAMQGLLTLLAGAVQLALGAYVYDKVEGQRLLNTGGYLGGPYAITYPEVAITFGCFQTLLGIFIVFRAFQKPGDQNAMGLKIFQGFAWFVLVFSVTAQVLAQLSMVSNAQHDTAEPSGFAAQAVALVVGLALFPIYLDVMYYTTPATIEEGTFSRNAPWIPQKDIESGEKKAKDEGVKAVVGTDAKAVEGGDEKPTGDVKPAEASV